jgi:hypothetical protein
MWKKVSSKTIVAAFPSHGLHQEMLLEGVNSAISTPKKMTTFNRAITLPRFEDGHVVGMDEVK